MIFYAPVKKIDVLSTFTKHKVNWKFSCKTKSVWRSLRLIEVESIGPIPLRLYFAFRYKSNKPLVCHNCLFLFNVCFSCMYTFYQFSVLFNNFIEYWNHKHKTYIKLKFIQYFGLTKVFMYWSNNWTRRLSVKEPI